MIPVCPLDAKKIGEAVWFYISTIAFPAFLFKKKMRTVFVDQPLAKPVGLLNIVKIYLVNPVPEKFNFLEIGISRLFPYSSGCRGIMVTGWVTSIKGSCDLHTLKQPGQ